MKDWIICPCDGGGFWLTRIVDLPGGGMDYLCGCCDGPLTDFVLGFFESSRGSSGCVASSVCWKCNVLLNDELPAGEFNDKIELLLAEAVAA